MEKKTINLHLERLEGSERLILSFPGDSYIELIIKSIPGANWSRSFKAWHVAYNLSTMVLLENKLKGLAILDFSSFDVSKKEQPDNSLLFKTVPDDKILNSKVLRDTRIIDEDLKNPDCYDEPRISFPSVTTSINEFESYLRHRRYSGSTITSYSEAVKRFLLFTDLPFGEIDNSHLIRFNNYIKTSGYSYSFQNQVASGLKLFFERIHNRKFDLEKIERPRREHKLPNVLSKEEVRKLLATPVNIKHRTMLSLIYACGLRRSELINMRPSDIDSKRGLIIIKQAKGNKDRIVPLPAKILGMLRTYYRACKPEKWLFEGQVKGNQYSPTSLAKVLKNSLSRAGINKPVSLHWLRHSYATHLLEQGTDLRIIQELLGHKSSRTTEIYTHVSTKSIQQVKSPFEDFDI